MRLLGIATLILLAVSLPALAQDESNSLATATGDEEPAVATKLAQIDLPGTDDPELAEIAGAVLDEHGLVLSLRRLPRATWQAYQAKLEGKAAQEPTAFAYWLLAAVSSNLTST